MSDPETSDALCQVVHEDLQRETLRIARAMEHAPIEARRAALAEAAQVARETKAAIRDFMELGE